MEPGRAHRKPLRVLLLEDDEDDAILTVRELRRYGLNLEWVRIVQSEGEYREYLDDTLDLILADHFLPGFDSERALDLRNRMAPSVPFIVVSGHIPEALAIQLMRRGAVDFLMKDRLSRLGPAVESAIRLSTLQRESGVLQDPLTKLPRTAPLLQLVGQAMETARPLHAPIGDSPDADASRFAVLMIDVDRIQNINASMGFAAGDLVLVEIARRLEGVLGEGHGLARVGGDKFAALVEGLSNRTDALALAERIHHRLATPMDIVGEDMFVSVCIGMALSNPSYINAEEILRDAETAMYRAKRRGRARHEIFESQMRVRAKNILRTEAELRRALERRDFHLEYQPIVSFGTGRVAGFEALIRWDHAERGLVKPSVIIPIAEESGLIVPIGRWVLDEATRQLSSWQARWPQAKDVYMAVNVSARQFSSPDFVQDVDDVLRASGVEAKSLALELTETVLMQSDSEGVSQQFRQLQNMGVRVLLDDFGTGYSSLSYLSRYPVDGIKIDRSFVGTIEGQRYNRAIILMILGLAKSLNLPVIAEGIESESQKRELTQLGCSLGQGYHLSRPLRPEQIYKVWERADEQSATP